MNFNPSNRTHREELVSQVREMVQEHFPDEQWLDRCPHVAFHTAYVLRGYGLSGYRIVAGRVEDVSGDSPIVLFEGTYTGTGASEYHTWVVGPDEGNLDFSIIPTRYHIDHLWQPYSQLPLVEYTQINETSEVVNEHLRSTYNTMIDWFE